MECESKQKSTEETERSDLLDFVDSVSPCREFAIPILFRNIGIGKQLMRIGKTSYWIPGRSVWFGDWSVRI
jgi:hypothetical protein